MSEYMTDEQSAKNEAFAMMAKPLDDLFNVEWKESEQ